MKKYAHRIGYRRDLLMNCVERVREKTAEILYIDNLDYDISRYVDWVVRNEVTHYIAETEKKSKITSVSKIEELSMSITTEEVIDKISTSVLDEDQVERIKEIFQSCRNDRERQILALRFGLIDGVPKTLQEVATEFGISRERVRQIENMALRRMSGHIRRRKTMRDYLHD